MDNEPLSDMDNLEANEIFDHKRTYQYTVVEISRISDCNTVKPFAIFKTLLLCELHQNSELTRFLVLEKGKNFIQSVIGLPQKVKGCQR